jgi:nicotinic acid phosphoribosyltransferase
MYHNVTDGRGQLIVFNGNIQDIYGDELEEIFKYTNSKKELKDKIVSFVKEDPRIYEILQVKGISKLINLIRNADTEEEIKFYTTELRNQMRINYDRIDAPLNKTVKGFIDFYIK